MRRRGSAMIAVLISLTLVAVVFPALMATVSTEHHRAVRSRWVLTTDRVLRGALERHAGRRFRELRDDAAAGPLEVLVLDHGRLEVVVELEVRGPDLGLLVATGRQPDPVSARRRELVRRRVVADPFHWRNSR